MFPYFPFEALNVEKLDGSRAIGTYIPAVSPDGTPNPVVSSILRGETFNGRAYVVNAWYVTAYEPILDENQEVVGILYVTEDDQILLITKNGKIIRTGCAEIRSVGRATQGVTVINTEDDDAVVAAVKVVERDEDEEAEGEVLETDGDEPGEPVN